MTTKFYPMKLRTWVDVRQWVAAKKLENIQPSIDGLYHVEVDPWVFDLLADDVETRLVRKLKFDNIESMRMLDVEVQKGNWIPVREKMETFEFAGFEVSIFMSEAEGSYARPGIVKTVAWQTTKKHPNDSEYGNALEWSVPGEAQGSTFETMTLRQALKKIKDDAVETLSSVMRRPIEVARSERVLRTAIIDLLCLPLVNAEDADPTVHERIGGRLRAALNESRDPDEHPEDRCEECRQPFEPWAATPEDWKRVTGRNWGGPILCQPCFEARVKQVTIRVEKAYGGSITYGNDGMKIQVPKGTERITIVGSVADSFPARLDRVEKMVRLIAHFAEFKDKRMTGEEHKVLDDFIAGLARLRNIEKSQT